MDYKNIAFLGTSHIAKESYEQVKFHIENIKPDIIALELDRNRLQELMHGAKSRNSIRSIRSIGLKGYLFAALGSWAEKKLGKLTGFSPGSEMKHAVKLARANGMKISLIDQDIEITLKRLSEHLTWKEKFNFFADVLKAMISRKAEFEFDLSKVPQKELIKQLLAKVKTRYPNVYKVLIKERNRHMFRILKRLSEENPDKKILAVIGAGHVDDIIEMLKSNSDAV